MPARKNHWISVIAEEVRERAFDAVDHVAAGLADSVPFGQPDAPVNRRLDLDDYLQAPAEMRQALLQGLGPDELPETMSRLHNEAVDRFGPMAQAILPMLTMEEAQTQIGHLSTENPTTGLVAAHAELTELLGMDPFS